MSTFPQEAEVARGRLGRQKSVYKGAGAGWEWGRDKNLATDNISQASFSF